MAARAGETEISTRRRKRTRQEARRSDDRAGADLAWLVIGCALLAVVAMRFRLIDRIIDWSKAFDTFNLDGLMALGVLVPVAATVYSYRRYQDAMEVRHELARLSLHDSLTGLPNRLYLNDWLAHDLAACHRTNTHVAVLFIDLDRFKLVNDTYGHEIGDELMVAVAGRIRKTLRPEDRVVRYGGDEFVAVCPEIANVVSVERIAGRIIEALESPFTIGTDTMRISTSIGIALAEDPDTRPDDVVREADVAMYQAKSAGTGKYTVFDPTRHGSVLAPLSAETRLRAALQNGEFRLFYQPVVDMKTGSMVGVESLIRWLDPERGIVPPVEFIPILEDTGLIVPVGEWVLREACRQAKRWRDQYPERRPLKVTVNVSARQLAQVDFRDVVTSALQESGVDHDQICLEITEGALMFDVSSAWATLRHAKSLGVHLALDDFGTGYSSLSYVRRFSLDMLKIDRSFVEGLGQSAEDTAIVEHVIGMAQALGMVTVAEGIERPDQLRELQRLGCDLAQGYFFSPPVPVDKLEELIADPERARTWARWTAGQIDDPHAVEAHVAVPAPAPSPFATPEPAVARRDSAPPAVAAPPRGRDQGAPGQADDTAPTPALPRLREFRPAEPQPVPERIDDPGRAPLPH